MQLCNFALFHTYRLVGTSAHVSFKVKLRVGIKTYETGSFIACYGPERPVFAKELKAARPTGHQQIDRTAESNLKAAHTTLPGPFPPVNSVFASFGAQPPAHSGGKLHDVETGYQSEIGQTEKPLVLKTGEQLAVWCSVHAVALYTNLFYQIVTPVQVGMS